MLHVWDETYEKPSPASLTDHKGNVVGIVVRGTATDDAGNTKSVTVDLFDSEGNPLGSVNVTQVRIIGQLATLSRKGADRTIAAVVPYGKRGIVLAPPAKAPTKALTEAVEKA